MTEKGAGKDRRKFPRIDAEIPVTYKKLPGLTSLQFEALEEEIGNNVTKDISRSGICIKTETNIPPNTILEIILRFPTRRIKAIGKVVWSKPIGPHGGYYAGIEYVAIADAQVNAMVQSVAEYMIGTYKTKDAKPSGKLKGIFGHMFRGGK